MPAKTPYAWAWITAKIVHFPGHIVVTRALRDMLSIESSTLVKTLSARKTCAKIAGYQASTAVTSVEKATFTIVKTNSVTCSLARSHSVKSVKQTQRYVSSVSCTTGWTRRLLNASMGPVS